MKTGTNPKDDELAALLAELSDGDRAEVLAAIKKRSAESKRIIRQNTKAVLTDFVNSLSIAPSARSKKRPRRG